MIKTVGIVGYGNFGQFVHLLGQKFFPDFEFKIFSNRSKIDRETFFSLEEVGESDILIMCGSIAGYEEQLKIVLPLISESTIVVDVATVKKHTVDLLRENIGAGKFISTHPMFGPESYKKHNENVDGFRIVVADHNLDEFEYQNIKSLFTNFGFLVIEMSADEHDKILAETLFLTHYVGQSIIKAGFSRTAIDTLSFQFLMDAVESVKDDKKLFADVYKFNPYCEAVAARLHKAQEEVFQIVKK